MTEGITTATRVILGLTLAALLGLSIGWASEVVMTRVNAERIAQEQAR